MRQPSPKTRRLQAGTAALLAAAGLAITGAGATAAAAPAGAATVSSDGAASAWHLYLALAPVDAQGNPSLDLPAGVTITATAGALHATCTLPAGRTELACDLPAAGLAIPRGTAYTVTATHLPPGTVAGNVGTFTTGTTFAGPQCRANPAGLMDPCHHVVTVGPAHSDAPLLPGGVALTGSTIDGGAGEHNPAPPVEVTVAEDGAATVTTLSDGAGGAAWTGATASPASPDPGSAAVPAAAVERTRGAQSASGPADLSTPVSGLTAASTVALPATSDSSAVIVLACLGLLLCAAAAFALVHWSHEEPEAR